MRKLLLALITAGALMAASLAISAPAGAHNSNSHCASITYKYDWNTGKGAVSNQGHSGSQCAMSFTVKCRHSISTFPYYYYSWGTKTVYDSPGGGSSAKSINCSSGGSYWSSWVNWYDYAP